MHDAVALLLVCLAAPPHDLDRFPPRTYAWLQLQAARRDKSYWEARVQPRTTWQNGQEECYYFSPLAYNSPERRAEIEAYYRANRRYCAWLALWQRDRATLRDLLTAQEWAAGQMP